MIVRPAEPADAPAMAAIAARSYRSAFAAILEEEVLAARNEAFFAELFGRSVEHLRLAEEDGRPVAFCLAHDGHIQMLFADPDHIGAGAGSALLAAAEADGATTLECFAENAPARRFYERRGWRLAKAYSRPFIGREREFVLFAKPRQP